MPLCALCVPACAPACCAWSWVRVVAHCCVPQVTVGMNSCVDFVFLSHSPGTARDPDAVERRVAKLSGAALTQLAAEREAEFDDRFAQVGGEKWFGRSICAHV